MKKSKQLLTKLKDKFDLKTYYERLHLPIKRLSTFKDKFDLKTYTTRIKPSIWVERFQDKLEEIVSKQSNPNQVILQQSKFWARSITWVLIGGTAFSIGWLCIAETEEIVVAQGKLEPKAGVFEVQMPLSGVAREILVKEGDKVKKNQVLIRLDTEINEARNIALRKNLESNIIIMNKFEKLAKEGAISEIQYLQQTLKVEDLKSDIKSNLVKLKYQEIVAPSDGMIFELKPNGPGYVAQTSQPILKIVPLDKLIAKVEINSRTIGFVQPGKVAEISIDSFPASDFGVIKGKVTKISSDALPPSPAERKGYRFPADITLNNQYLLLKTGQKLSLQAGMSLTANIKLRKVTYLKLLLNKFTDRADSLKKI